MDKYDYHFISIKFLTAILLALVFAFLLVYVFRPQLRDDYTVYSLQQSDFELQQQRTARDDLSFQNFRRELAAANLDFEEELKIRSFELMKSSRDSLLAVITANHLEKMNGLRELRMRRLENERIELAAAERELLQQRRQELEAELAQKLQQLRQEIRKKYSGFNQQQLRDNYLKMINLRLKIDFVARSEAERDTYRQQLAAVEAEQEELKAARNSRVNEDISNRTSTLIMEFNQQYAAYRDQIRNQNQNSLTELRQEIENELAEARTEIKSELALSRQQKEIELDQLIEKTKTEYY